MLYAATGYYNAVTTAVLKVVDGAGVVRRVGMADTAVTSADVVDFQSEGGKETKSLLCCVFSLMTIKTCSVDQWGWGVLSETYMYYHITSRLCFYSIGIVANARFF